METEGKQLVEYDDSAEAPTANRGGVPAPGA
jgi:hypothetical protein